MSKSQIIINKSRLFGTKGSEHQRKEWIKINGENYLVKINSYKHEASKEEDAYRLAVALGIDCAEYSEEKFELDGTIYNGCLSKSLLEDGEQIVNIYEIVEFNGDWDWHKSNTSIKEKYENLTSIINEVTSIEYNVVKEYLMKVILFDYLICNKDRHYGNFAVIQKIDSTYRVCPLYDNGDSFLGSDSIWSKNKLEGKIAEYDKFKTRMFSAKGDKVLADKDYAKEIYIQLLNGRKMKDILDGLELKEGHKQVIEARSQQLEKILHI